jgi:glycerophosphoryl diester phosphodiesterase
MPNTKPIVIAHRGACGYLPEHTLPAKALAHSMGADFIEQDVVLSKDGIAVVLHDIYLDSTTDVAQQFPGHARDDGHFYALDFTLGELRQLHLHERSRQDAHGNTIAVYPHRFPVEHAFFQIPTLAEEIALIAGLDHSRGRRTGLYVELKSPNWHLAQGYDLARAVMDVLIETGYDNLPEQVFLQCFDDKTLQTLAKVHKTKLPMIQLIANNDWGEDSEVDYDYLRTPEGLSYVATYAQGIGPWAQHIYNGKTKTGAPLLTDLVAQAHERNLLVHPYTFRQDELPEGIDSFDELLDIFIQQARVDGFFTDFADLAVEYIQRAKL